MVLWRISRLSLSRGNARRLDFSLPAAEQPESVISALAFTHGHASTTEASDDPLSELAWDCQGLLLCVHVVLGWVREGSPAGHG